MKLVTQLPSKMIEAFSLPSASPHQPTPSCAGVCAIPDLSQLMYVETAVWFAGELTIACVLLAFRKPPPFWYMNARIRARSMLRQIGGWPAALSAVPALWSCAHVVGVGTFAFPSIDVFTCIASGDQSFGRP